MAEQTASDFPEFDRIVAMAQAAGAVLSVNKSPSYCSAILAEGEFKAWALVASARINGEGPELCDPNAKMMRRLGLAYDEGAL